MPFPSDLSNPIQAEKMQLARNIDRQKALVADTNRLLKLASELNDEVNGAHSGALTDSQLIKVAEIEKLAHSVREEMCASMLGAPPKMLGPSMDPAPMIPLPHR
jgi:hypothetical protein